MHLPIHQRLFQGFKNLLRWSVSTRRKRYILASILDLMLILVIMHGGLDSAHRALKPLISPLTGLHSISGSKSNKEVFGFAPYFTFDKLNNVDFNILTTLAYFGVPVDGDGNLDKTDPGYDTFTSSEATELFKKAHGHSTRVVLTLTQMHNGPILSLVDDAEAQERAINQAVTMVKDRGIDGLNVDFEFMGDPGQEYRNRFSNFVKNLTDRMHSSVPGSKVTVSVYASSVKEPKIYDIAKLGQISDGIFMMAYDFATASSDNAIPTAPLYGKNSPRAYWYDIATAVDDFLKLMPAQKLILGVPYYGYNHLVYTPEVKAETRPSWSWRGTPRAQTYSVVQNDIKPDMEGIDDYKEGRDPDSQVPYKAYHVTSTDTWRIVFADDRQSLGVKYDFAKQKNLAGVGMWALGFDEGKRELWDLLAEKFGGQLAQNSSGRSIQ